MNLTETIKVPFNLRENKHDLAQTKELYWWLWRCLPEEICRQFDDYSLLLMPAETRLPDSSIWNHASLTSAMAGALAGYSLTTEEIDPRSGKRNRKRNCTILSLFRLYLIINHWLTN